MSNHARRELRAPCGVRSVVKWRLCNQPRVLDLQARKARFIEKIPDFIIDEVLAKGNAHRIINGGLGAPGGALG